MAHQAPIVNQAGMHAAAPAIYQSAMGLPTGDLVTLPSDPIQQQPTYQGALSAFEALPQIGCCSTMAPAPPRPAS